MIKESLNVASASANQVQAAAQGISWKDWLPNLLNFLAAIGSLGAAVAAWRTLVQMRRVSEEEKDLSSPILQFLSADATIANMTKPFEPIYLEMHYANARKSNILTANHISFVINEENKIYTYYSRELPCGGNTRDILTFDIRLMPESKFKDKAWTCISFIEVITPEYSARREICVIRIPGRDNDNLPSSQINQLVCHPYFNANYYKLEWILDKDKVILSKYLKNFRDNKWSKFCSKFKSYYKPSWEWILFSK